MSADFWTACAQFAKYAILAYWVWQSRQESKELNRRLDAIDAIDARLMCVPFDHEFFAVGVPARAFCRDRMGLLPKLLVSNGIHFR